MRPLRVLYLADAGEDMLPVERDLRRNGWAVESTRVATTEELRDALHGRWDVILSEYRLSRLGAPEALDVLHASDRPGTPFIVVSGSIGEEAAIELLRRGADDFVHKDNLARLSPAIDRELSDAQVRREKHQARRPLAEALASREELIAVAGHELRNPLAALQLSIDRLHRSSRAPEHAQVLSRHAGRLRDLVTRLVDIAALDAGSFELHPSDIELSRVAAKEVQRIFTDADRVLLDAPVPVPVHADLSRLQLVLASLLDNALKFGGTEPVTVRVRRDADGGLVEVADRGPGLQDSDREMVFQPFGKRVSSRHYGGFGLSLWLGRSILERHGGSLVALPNPGGGALFRLRVPARPVSRNGPGSSPGEPRPPPVSG